MERTDRLRKRPNSVRYYYMAQSENNTHLGSSYGSLVYTIKKNNIIKMFLSDIVIGKVFEVKEPIQEFMLKWRMNYNNPEWNYFEENLQVG